MRKRNCTVFSELENIPSSAILIPECAEDDAILLALLAKRGVVPGQKTLLPGTPKAVGTLCFPQSTPWDSLGRLSCQVVLEDGKSMGLTFWVVVWEGENGHNVWWSWDNAQHQSPQAGFWDNGRLTYSDVPLSAFEWPEDARVPDRNRRAA